MGEAQQAVNKANTYSQFIMSQWTFAHPGININHRWIGGTSLKECELMAMHDHPLTSAEGIPSELVRYLGFKISKDLRLREEK